MIHIVTGRTLDINKIAAEAAAGEAPGHVLVTLSQQTPTQFHMPSDALQPTTIDRVHARLMGSPNHWALARHLGGLLRESPLPRATNTLFCTGEDVGIPVATTCGNIPNRPRIVVTAHNIMRPKARLAMTLHRTTHHVDLWITPSQTQADFLIGSCNVPLEKVVVIPEQTDTNFYYPASADAGRNTTAKPIIASVGLEQRDYRTLAEATHDLPVDVRISGHSPDARAIGKAFPTPMPANMQRQFYEWKDLRTLYQTASIVVVPLFENAYVAGITTFLEALACRKSVILARTAGMAPFADIPGICLTVPPNNARALRTAISHLLHSPSTAEALATRGYEWLMAGHTANHWVSAVRECLLSQGSASTPPSPAQQAA